MSQKRSDSGGSQHITTMPQQPTPMHPLLYEKYQQQGPVAPNELVNAGSSHDVIVVTCKGGSRLIVSKKELTALKLFLPKYEDIDMHRLVNTLPLLLQEMDASCKATVNTNPQTPAGSTTPSKGQQGIPIPSQVKVNKLIRNPSGSSLFAEMAKEYEAKIADLEAQLASEKMNVERLELEKLTLKESLLQKDRLEHDTDSRAKEQASQVDLLQNEITELKAKNDALAVTCQGKDDEISRHSQMIASLEAAIEQHKADLAQFSQDGEGKDAQIAALTVSLREKEAELSASESTVAARNATIAALTAQLADAHAKAASLLRQTSAMAGELSAIKTQVEMEALQNEATVKATMDELTEHVVAREEELYSQLDREILERKRMTEKYHEVSGKIRVFCRVRPLKDRNTEESAFMFPKAQTLLVASKRQEFVFDQVYGPDSTQEDVYEHVDPLIGSVMDGYNACVMAYGQTGAGKTYSMVGEDSAPGIIPRALQQLFAMSDARSVMYEDSISISMQEIYNDQPRDLLSKDILTPKDVMESRPVGSWKEVQQVLGEGYANRSVAATKMNFESSRSHAIVFVYVTSAHRQTLERKSSTLCLVDLAGSERISRTQVTGDRLKEAQHINKSLSTLGDVVHALQHKAKHVPYRNSKLTFTLRDMLSGGAKALLVLQVSPDIADEGESICSLQFGARVSQVELGAVKQRSVESGELLTLKDDLAKQRADADATVAKMQREIDTLKEALANSNQNQSVNGYGGASTDDEEALDDEWKKLNEETPESSGGSGSELKKKVLTKRTTSSAARLSLGRNGIPPSGAPPKPVRQSSLDRRLSLPVKAKSDAGSSSSAGEKPAPAPTVARTSSARSTTSSTSSTTSTTRVARHSLSVAEGTALREKTRTKTTTTRSTASTASTSPPARKWV
ncbi:unnamed protein product [Aphanomyces euteiches]|uniref:Kinesin-like protein n=2 Tax=Aphanomyces euteiches TaxID=100861 RepID=A0A6G0XL76_9STRA|nr:hypothetical protein Ae201684_003806 [Aphanomyces euteiches]KAH9084609.1 hypothetical protein Ae201684P_001851 [Aphanomyces euteiches]KAH9145789.1 hypothetical protein AeRB84_010297 [Aphanomyces euteiches]